MLPIWIWGSGLSRLSSSWEVGKLHTVAFFCKPSLSGTYPCTWLCTLSLQTRQCPLTEKARLDIAVWPFIQSLPTPAHINIAWIFEQMLIWLIHIQNCSEIWKTNFFPCISFENRISSASLLVSIYSSSGDPAFGKNLVRSRMSEVGCVAGGGFGRWVSECWLFSLPCPSLKVSPSLSLFVYFKESFI